MSHNVIVYELLVNSGNVLITLSSGRCVQLSYQVTRMYIWVTAGASDAGERRFLCVNLRNRLLPRCWYWSNNCKMNVECVCVLLVGLD